MSDIVPISFNGQGLFPVSSGKARTKAQQALIEYLCECMESGRQPDGTWMSLNIYKKHVRQISNRIWLGDSCYHERQDAVTANPDSLVDMYRHWIGGEYQWKYRPYKMEYANDEQYKYPFAQWYKSNLGSLLQQGLLFAIPTGYILKKIDATIEISE